MTKTTTTFDSFEAFLQQAQKPGTLGNLTQSSKLGQLDWYGTSSFNDAVQLAEKGWPDGLQRMQALQSSLLSYQGSKDRRFENAYSESGDEPDVSRYLAGESENMVHYEPQYVPAQGRVIKIVVCASVSSGISTEMIFMKGAAAVMLADLIERSGLRAEIWMGLGMEAIRSPHMHEMWVKVKEPEQALELDRLSFVTAHASFLRRLVFRVLEQKSVKDFSRENGPGYFRPRDVEVEADTVYIGALQYGFGNQVNTEADCIKFVNTTLARYTEPERTA